MIKEKVKALWKLCFEDSEAFIEMYFRLRYNNEVNIAIESGDEVISALQMLPYPMTFCGKQIQTSYISGACTHPDYRGKGVMKELLSQALTKMLQQCYLKYIDPGRTLVIRLLCPYGICTGILLFRKRYSRSRSFFHRCLRKEIDR